MGESRDAVVPQSDPKGELWAARSIWEKAHQRANDEERSVDSAYREIVHLVEIGDLQGAKKQMEVRQELLVSFAVAALEERRAKRTLDDVEMNAMAEDLKRQVERGPISIAPIAHLPLWHVRYDVDISAEDGQAAGRLAAEEIHEGLWKPTVERYGQVDRNG